MWAFGKFLRKQTQIDALYSRQKSEVAQLCLQWDLQRRQRHSLESLFSNTGKGKPGELILCSLQGCGRDGSSSPERSRDQLKETPS